MINSKTTKGAPKESTEERFLNFSKVLTGSCGKYII